MKSRLTLLRLTLGATLLMSATPAAAYLSPDEVFRGIDTPPNNRSAEQQVQAQQKASAQARQEAQSQLPSTEDEPAPPASQPVIVPAEQAVEGDERGSYLTGEGQYERRQDRLQSDFPQGTTIIIQNGEAVVRDRQTGTVLHSGAPRVTATGPAEFLAIGTLLFAATATFLWVRARELHPLSKILK